MSNEDEKEKNKNAFNFANSCRDKEIDRFWSRALYFWGFIAASFTAYITVLKLSLGCKSLTLENIIGMDFTAKIILAVLSFVCFVFCLLWQLIHKASKFWQDNWENYVCELEQNIFNNEIYGNPKDIKSCVFPLCSNPYRYSVSKISSNSAILLTILSLAFAIFNFANLFQSVTFNSEILKAIAASIISLLAFIYSIGLCFLCKSKKQIQSEE